MSNSSVDPVRTSWDVLQAIGEGRKRALPIMASTEASFDTVKRHGTLLFHAKLVNRKKVRDRRRNVTEYEITPGGREALSKGLIAFRQRYPGLKKPKK